jgi:hypothetical protein
VCINYSDVSFQDETELRLLHLEGGEWIDRTSSVDMDEDVICAVVNSLSPFVVAERVPLTLLGPASVWLGLKNSDDVGTRFDVLAEVLKNGSVVGSGQIWNVPGGSSGFNNAILRNIPMTLSGSVPVASGDTVSIRISVRIGATGHRSGTARLWYNDAAANTRFSATFGESDEYYLLGTPPLTLSKEVAGPGPKKTIDVKVDRAVGGNPFKPFGTWSVVVP